MKQEKALVSKCATSAVKHPPAVPLGWCLKWGAGADLVKMTRFERWLSDLGGVLGGVGGKYIEIAKYFVDL